MPVVLQEPEHVERRRDDAAAPAVGHDAPLLLGRDRPSAGAPQRVDGERLHAEADRGETGLVQRVDERRVQPVEPGLALEPDLQAREPDLIAERQAPVAIVR